MFRSIDPSSISTSELHQYLLGAVAPRPICFASTTDSEGNVNLSPFSFFNVFGSNPPIMIFSPARRGRDNTNKHTFDNVKSVPETVINIVNFPIVEQMSLASTEYPKGVNEFVKAGFTEVPSERVAPPRVKEAPVAFECKVNNVIETGQGGGAGNLVIAEVLLIHVDSKYIDEKGKLDTTKLDLVGRMGGSWYVRASGPALFEIPKPLRTRGIGIDQLPEHIRQSDILSANNLGRLGNVESLPSVEMIKKSKLDPKVKEILSLSEKERKEALHGLAKAYIESGATEKGLSILMI